MYGLVLQVLVMFPAVTYVKMHLVCRSLFFFFLLYFLLQYLFFRLCFVKEIQAFDSHFGKMYVAFFYCEVDGSNLCLQCDMIVHVGGKRTHGRYLLLRQRVEVCNCYTEILESQSCYFYVKFFFETICLFCSFQGINYLVILRSQVRNPQIKVRPEGDKIRLLNLQWQRTSKVIGSLLFLFLMLKLMEMPRWIK